MDDVALYTIDCSDRGLFACSPSSVFGPEDSPISVANDEFGIRMSATGEQRRVTAALLSPSCRILPEQTVVVLPRSAMHFRIVTAL